MVLALGVWLRITSRPSASQQQICKKKGGGRKGRGRKRKGTKFPQYVARDVRSRRYPFLIRALGSKEREKRKGKGKRAALPPYGRHTSPLIAPSNPTGTCRKARAKGEKKRERAGEEEEGEG